MDRDVLSTQECVPSVRPKVGPVAQKPVHSFWIVRLRFRPGMRGVFTDAILRPDDGCFRHSALQRQKLGGFVSIQGLNEDTKMVV